MFSTNKGKHYLCVNTFADKFFQETELIDFCVHTFPCDFLNIHFVRVFHFIIHIMYLFHTNNCNLSPQPSLATELLSKSLLILLLTIP